MQEQSINCFDCGVTFTFTVEEQQAYEAKSHFHAPKRCPSCRQARKTERMGASGMKQRQMYPAVCAECGKDTEVPFEPREGRPVYCSDCFSKMRTNR